MDYPTKKLYDEKIDVDSDLIYYFYTYWKYDDVKSLSFDDNRRINVIRILNFKNGDDEAFMWFRKCFRNHLEELKDKKWIICSIPSHDQTLPIPNNVDDFIKFCNLPNNMLHVPCLITRKVVMPQKHGPSYGERTPQRDYNSYKIRKDYEDLADKNIIIFDDVTTTGSSLVAARRFLREHGAKKVVCIALGKTLDKYDY